MIRPQPFRQLAAYGISMPTFAVSPKLAKETVYMPSQIAARLLGSDSRPDAAPAGRDAEGAAPGLRASA